LLFRRIWGIVLHLRLGLSTLTGERGV